MCTTIESIKFAIHVFEFKCRFKHAMADNNPDSGPSEVNQSHANVPCFVNDNAFPNEVSTEAARLATLTS